MAMMGNVDRMSASANMQMSSFLSESTDSVHITDINRPYLEIGSHVFTSRTFVGAQNNFQAFGPE